MNKFLFAALVSAPLWLSCREKKPEAVNPPRAAAAIPDFDPMALPPAAGADTVRTSGVDSVRVGDTLTIVPWTAITVTQATVTTGVPTRLLLGVPFIIFSEKVIPPANTYQAASDPSTIVAKIANARATGTKLVFFMADGSHERYKSNGRFDMAKWKARVNLFNTPAIRAAVATGVAEGLIIGGKIIDEPNHKSWGLPEGTIISKAMLGEMVAYQKAIFPTLPAGWQIGPRVISWRTNERLPTMDYTQAQYDWWITKGNIAVWRDSVLRINRLDGTKTLFAINILDGGVRTEPFDSWICSIPLTGGRGTYKNACRMTPQQIRQYSSALVGYSCGFNMWAYDSVMFSKPEYQTEFRNTATMLRNRPKTGCKRGTP